MGHITTGCLGVTTCGVKIQVQLRGITDLLSQDQTVCRGVAEPRIERIQLVRGACDCTAAAQAIDLDEVFW